MNRDAQIEFLLENLALAERRRDAALDAWSSCQLNRPGRCKTEERNYNNADREVRRIKRQLNELNRRVTSG